MYANVVRTFRRARVREQLSLYLHRNTITFVMSRILEPTFLFRKFLLELYTYSQLKNRILKANRELPSLRQRGDTILYFRYTAIRILTSRFNPRSTGTPLERANARSRPFLLSLGKTTLHLRRILSMGNCFLFPVNVEKQ